MKDSEVLDFIHSRLVCVHKEKPQCDYMVRLLRIITAIRNQELCEKESAMLKEIAEITVATPPQTPLYDKDTVDSIITSLCNENKRLKDLLLSKGNG